MAIIDIKRTVSLDGAIMPVALEGTLYGGENQAHRFIINATKDGAALNLTGSVTASFLRKANDAEVPLTGEIIGGGAAVTLAQSCYTQPGRFELTIFLTQNGSKTALYSCNGNVRNTSASEIVDPGHVVPDISDIVAEYARMQAASDAAEAAAANANEAAQFATDDEWTNGDTLQTGRVYQTLHMANFEEETAGQYLRVISGNVAQAERVNQSGWSVYRYDLPHRMLIRLEAIEKNTPTIQGVLPMAAVLTSGGTETLYSLDGDRTGTYVLADALLVNYSTTLNASAIKSVSITAVANRQFEDVIVCLDHAAEFDKIVVFGDSIFANYINSTTVGNGVMAQFASLMGLPVVNNAVGGATLSTIQTNPKSVVQQVQDYIASATPGGTPLYMIDGGTNDQYNGGAGLLNLGQYTDGVNGITNTIYGATYKIINDLLGFGAQPWQIVITTPIPKGIRGNAAYVATMDAQLTAIAGAMAEIAMVQQCNVINGYGAPFDNLTTDTAKAIIMPDDTHPSVQGAKMYAERIFRLLGTAMQPEVASLKSALNGENILALYGTKTNRTHNGVTFSWNGLTCTVTGTATDGAVCNIINGSSAIPSYIKPGKKYKFFYNATDNDIQLEWLIYKNGAYDSTNRFTTDTIFTVPTDASGIIIRLRVAGGQTVNGSITPIITRWPIAENINTSLKIANFGDSLTWGRNGSQSSATQTKYTITNALKDLGCDAYNFGVGSQGYFSVGGNMTALQKLQATDLSGYDVITLGFGTNDNTANLGSTNDTDGTTMIGAMYQCWQYIRTQNPNCVVIFIAPPNARSFGEKATGYWYSYRRGPLTSYNLTDLVNGMRDFCRQYSIPFIDNLGNGIDVENITSLQPDSVHFNDDGYKIYSRYIANCILDCVYATQSSSYPANSEININRLYDSVTSEYCLCSKNSVGNFIFTTYPSNSLKLTDYISVEENRTIRIKNFRLNNKILVVLFDKNKDVIDRILMDETAHDIASYDYKLPYGCAYIRFCVTNAQYTNKTFNIYYINNNEESANEFYPYIFNKNLYQNINSQPPMCVLIDDDTQGLSYVQAFHERCVANGIRGNYAVVTKNLDESAQLAETLQDYEAEGFGMLYHCDEQLPCYRGTNYSERDLVEAESNFVTGLRKMRTYGFLDYQWWVVPYGTIDDDMVAIGQRHGMKACMSAANATYVTTSKRTNRWKIPRCALNVSDAASSTGYTMDALKADMNNCYTEHGLLLITTHMNDGWTINNGELDATGKARFDEAIQYALGLGYKFVTFPEAMTYWMPMYQLNEMM